MNAVEVGRIGGSLERGGWQCEATVYGDADAVEPHRGLKLYGRTVVDGAWGEKTLFFSGHALPQDVRLSFNRSEARVLFHTSDEYLRQGSVQGIWFQDVSGTPANPHQHADLSLAYVVTHIVDGHTNLGPSTPPPNGHVTFDVDFANSARVSFYEVAEGNVWQRLREIAENEFYALYFTRTNGMRYRPHPYFSSPLPPISRTFTAAQVQSVELSPNRSEVKQVRLYAVTSAGATLGARYPTSAGNYGEIEEIDGLRCDDQGTLDTWAERRYRWAGRPYTAVVTTGGAAGLEVELLDRVGLTLSLPDDGISWVDKPAWVHEVEVTFREGFGAETRLTLEVEPG